MIPLCFVLGPSPESICCLPFSFFFCESSTVRGAATIMSKHICEWSLTLIIIFVNFNFIVVVGIPLPIPLEKSYITVPSILDLDVKVL